VNPYTFDRFLAWRSGVDFYADDPFLVQLTRHHAGPDFARVDGEARAISRRASSRWREASDAISVLEARRASSTGTPITAGWIAWCDPPRRSSSNARSSRRDSSPPAPTRSPAR